MSLAATARSRSFAPLLRFARRSPALALGSSIVGLVIVIALVAPLVAPYDPTFQTMSDRLQPSSVAHWLGTDGFGRDILSRLIYGTRPTLLIISLVALIMAPLGIAIGIVAGYYGGIVDRILMRFTDMAMSFPRLILAFAFVAVLGPGLLNAALALAVTSWPPYARQARVETQAMRRSDYMASVEMLGIRGPRLLFGHVLPLVFPLAIVRMALDLAGMVLIAAGLGFLGLGVLPPTAEWGKMVADGTPVIFDQWWVAASPGVAILILSLGFNLMADGLRDIMDPRHG
ncbi:MAG: ABC transporter permease [Ancalomicrobiaceae bacterium]|nr:ABC transporter permease [Ancalomicrobiaceae bacterium]